MSCLAGRRARLAQAPVAVHQQPSGDLRHAEVQEQVHVELIPEHVAPVGLAVEAAGPHPGVQVDRVMRQTWTIWQMCSRSRSCTRSSPGTRTSHPRHSSSQADACRANASSKPRSARRRPGLRRVSLIAGSREVKKVTIFSTRTVAPCRTSNASICWMWSSIWWRLRSTAAARRGHRGCGCAPPG